MHKVGSIFSIDWSCVGSCIGSCLGSRGFEELLCCNKVLIFPTFPSLDLNFHDKNYLKFIEKYKITNVEKYKITNVENYHHKMNRECNQLLKKHSNQIKKLNFMYMWINIAMYLFDIFTMIFLLLGYNKYFILFTHFLSNIFAGGYGHDSIHRKSNCQHFLTKAGFTSGLWLKQHTIIHHTKTNEPDDPDLIRFMRVFKIMNGLPALFLTSFYVGFSIYIKLAREFKYCSWLDIFQYLINYIQAYLMINAYGFVSFFSLRLIAGWWFILFDFNNHYTPNLLTNTKNMGFIEQQVKTSQDVILTNNYLFDSLVGFGLQQQTIHHLFPRLTNMECAIVSKEMYKIIEEKYTINKISFWEAIYNTIFKFNIEV